MAEDFGFPPEELKKFTDAGRTIAAAVVTSFQVWARAESGVILKTWAGRTKVAKPKTAELRAWVRAIRDLGFSGGKRNRMTSAGGANISVNAGLRGPRGRVFMRKKNATGNNQWRRTHNAGFAPINQHYKKGDWIDIQEAIASVKSAVARAVPLAIQAVGLARQSVVQIAEDLGIDLMAVRGGGTLSASGLAKARSALASNGNYYRNGYGQQFKNAQGFFIELVNRYPRAMKLKMDHTLAWVISGRLGYFRRNLEEGVFLSAAKAAKAYPYVQVLNAA